jgi:drug/metabolite transporter (DMT)-like permease
LKSRYYIEGLLAAFLFGLTPIFIKQVTANVVTIGIVRLSIAVILVYLLFVGKEKIKALKLRDWKALSLIGLVFGLHWISYFYSVKLATPSIALLGLTSFGIYVILIDWIFLKRQPTWVDGLSVSIAIGGNLLIVPEFSLQNDVTMGLVIGLFSALFFAFLPLLQQRSAHIDSYTRAFGQYFFGLIFFLLFISESEWDLPTNDWFYLSILGVVCTLGAHTLWLRATTMLPGTATSVIYYLAIPIAMITSYLFLEEAMPEKKVIGAVLIVGANLIGIVKHLKGTAFKKH